jgi:hypothetical protein
MKKAQLMNGNFANVKRGKDYVIVGETVDKYIIVNDMLSQMPYPKTAFKEVVEEVAGKSPEAVIYNDEITSEVEVEEEVVYAASEEEVVTFESKYEKRRK